MQSNSTDRPTDLFDAPILVGKPCSKCRRLLPFSQFSRRCDKGRENERHSICKQCKVQITKKYLRKPRNKDRARARRYGLTMAQFEAMMTAQQGKCAICGESDMPIDPRTGKRYDLAIDHDHVTGVVRDLLCPSCNNGLGCFDDDLDRLQAAISYLKRHIANR